MKQLFKLIILLNMFLSLIGCKDESTSTVSSQNGSSEVSPTPTPADDQTGSFLLANYKYIPSHDGNFYIYSKKEFSIYGESETSYIRKIDSNGNLAPGFGGFNNSVEELGELRIARGYEFDHVEKLILLDNNQILVASSTWQWFGARSASCRLLLINPDGTFDDSFKGQYSNSLDLMTATPYKPGIEIPIPRSTTAGDYARTLDIEVLPNGEVEMLCHYSSKDWLFVFDGSGVPYSKTLN